jgi:ferredoxin
LTCGSVRRVIIRAAVSSAVFQKPCSASSCESGTCGTCRTRLLAGEADHRDLVLTEDEQADHIMVCVSRAHSPEIVIDR